MFSVLPVATFIPFVPTRLGKLAVGVFCVFSGDGDLLLKKLLSGEVFLVVICPLEVTVGDVAPTAEPVVF